MRGHLIPTALPGAATNDLVLETQPWKAKQNGYGFSEMSCKRPEKQGILLQELSNLLFKQLVDTHCVPEGVGAI